MKEVLNDIEDDDESIVCNKSTKKPHHQKENKTQYLKQQIKGVDGL